MANRPLMKKSAPLPYPICTLAFDLAPTGEHGQRQVEAAPEKVDETALAELSPGLLKTSFPFQIISGRSKNS